MRWIFKTQLLLCAMLILSYVVTAVYGRWKETRSGSFATAAAVRDDAARAVDLERRASMRSRAGERVFVVASAPRHVDRAAEPRPLESLILLCPHGEAAEQTARMLSEYGYFDVRIMPGAAAAAAEAQPRRRQADRTNALRAIRLAPGCTEWRPFAM